VRQQGVVRYVHESHIEAPPEVVFAFHEAPGALARLVPPWERVEVVRPPSSLAPGTRVVLRMRFGPVPLTWEAEHTQYERGVLFQDRMVRGPFRRWIHTHRFLPHDGGTLLRDEVEYELPFYAVPAAPLVRWRLRRMFEYRHLVTATEAAAALQRRNEADTFAP
jgi:ligand-binding SRPBCC domain-containing protein